MTDHEQARGRGIRARELLENPLLVESFAAVRAECIAAWEAAPVRDAEGRERLWVMVKLLDKLKGHLETVAADGKLAEAEIAELEKKSRLRKVFG